MAPKYKPSERTVSRGLPVGSSIFMESVHQELVDGRWKAVEEKDVRYIDRDTFESMAGNEVCRWFNDWFGQGTFRRFIRMDDGTRIMRVVIINTAPSGTYRRVTRFRVKGVNTGLTRRVMA